MYDLLNVAKSKPEYKAKVSLCPAGYIPETEESEKDGVQGFKNKGSDSYEEDQMLYNCMLTL